ncbi:methionyl-tRNA formyltransferase [bacterium]|nr:methionyl-tRNA formyltransferase [bacterium]
MKNETKVAFFGTSDRSVPILETLNQEFNLVLCVTKSASKIGRKQELKETQVKKWAKDNKINHITISSLKEHDLTHVIEHLNSSKPDYIIVADFSLIIPNDLLDQFPNKFINIHFSLLPKYRGASPVQFALLNGDETTGITYHLVHEKLDRGAILSQVGYRIVGNETSGDLYTTLFEIAAQKLARITNEYASGDIKPREQHEKDATYTFSQSHPKSTHIYKEDAQINWKVGAEQIERAIRAYNPWPIAWTTLEDLENAKCLSGGKVKFKPHIDKNLKVKIYKSKFVGNKLEVKELQIEGKNRLTWPEFQNGYLV